MKIALAQINSKQGDIDYNVKKINKYINLAKKKGVELVVFPELSIPGYLSMDLFLNNEFIKRNKEGLKKVVGNSKDINVIIGFANSGSLIGPSNKEIIYNSAAIISNGKLVGIQNKTLLPEYDIFDEKRYFSSSNQSPKIFEIQGKKIGIQICEDLWDRGYNRNITEELISKDAELIINLSASPFYNGKLTQRIKEINRHVKKNGIPFIYVNNVGVQDGYDGQVVFDGRSIVTNPEGEIISIGKIFEEDLIVIDLDIKNKPIEIRENELSDLYNALVFGVKEYFNSFDDSKKAVIGLSGGIDSALVASIAVEALGANRVVGISMPSKYSSEHSKDDAIKLAENLGIEYFEYPIREIHEKFLKTFKENTGCEVISITDENIQARIRGNILMMYSNNTDSFVLSTGNKTEIALGYCTLYGDMSGGLSPIADVDKLNVYRLSRFINKIKGCEIIPINTIEKPPSAELAPDQKDEVGLGAPYEILVPLVNEIIEKSRPRKELIKMFDEKLVDNTLKRIYNNEFKRRQAPPGIKVTNKAFGIGRRIPMNHNFR